MSNAWPNPFRRRLLAGETLIGSWCALANPLTTEVLGLAGFDWLVLDVSGSKAFVVCNCGLFNAKYTEHSKQQVWEK